MHETRDALILRKVLTYANGYRELGMHKHALDELMRLPERLANEEQVWQMKLAIHMGAQAWQEALPIAEKLAKTHPEKSENHVNLAFVLRRARSIEEARAILIKAIRTFPDLAIIPYNLACYACQNNEMDDARQYLKEAFRLDSDYVDTGLKDEDLAPLYDWIEDQGEAFSGNTQ